MEITYLQKWLSQSQMELRKAYAEVAEENKQFTKLNFNLF
jgi:hypothetical protein